MSVWACRHCGSISHEDEVSIRDGWCRVHRTGNHSFQLQVSRDLPNYQHLLNAQKRIASKGDFVTGSDHTVKVGVDVADYIYPPTLLSLAIQMAQSLQELHRIASAGAPLGELPDDTFQAISELAGTNQE